MPLFSGSLHRRDDRDNTTPPKLAQIDSSGGQDGNVSELACIFCLCSYCLN